MIGSFSLAADNDISRFAAWPSSVFWQLILGGFYLRSLMKKILKVSIWIFAIVVTFGFVSVVIFSSIIFASV